MADHEDAVTPEPHQVVRVRKHGGDVTIVGRRDALPDRLDVEVGPFGSSVIVDLADVGTVIAALSDAAMANGATHVSVHVAREMPSAPPAFPIPKGVSE